MAITEVFIETLGPKGDGRGMAHHQCVYVPGTAPGDKVTAYLYKDKLGVLRGERVKILKGSSHRQTPPCAHYERCGNCTLQHLKGGFYQQWKIGMVKQAFQKQGIQPREWLSSVFIEPGRRRRVTFTAIKNKGRAILGYYRRRSDQVVEIDSCLVADPEVFKAREAIRLLVFPFLQPSKPVDIFMQKVGTEIELVLTGPITRSGEPDSKFREMAKEWSEVFSIQRIAWRLDSDAPLKTLVTKGDLVKEFGSIKIKLPPAAFLQPTEEGENALVQAVLKALPQSGRFADLFSGCGTFSGPMLTRGPVDAFESNAQAVRALAKAAGGTTLKAVCRDLFMRPLRREELNRYDAIVFDPPRAGCAAQAAAMASSKVKTLVGVSCNPATLARDAHFLCAGGYRLETIQLIDSFVWSHHTELVAVFKKAPPPSLRRPKA